MLLESVHIAQVRNLISVDLRPAPGLNLVYGANGAGKSSLLEGVYLLSTGRSFRSSRVDSVINYTAEALAVRGEVRTAAGRRMAVSVVRRRDGGAELRLGEQTVQSAAALAEAVPVQAITPDAVELVAGGPSVRRRFMDWGVFHVEPEFHDAWRAMGRIIRQRNEVLRGRASAEELATWDEMLAEVGERVDACRGRYVTWLIPRFVEVLARLGGPEGLELEYRRGWSANEPLVKVLRSGRERDAQRGYTSDGPHRADLRITAEGVRAREVLSRGQQKIAACAFILAQAALLKEKRWEPGILLIDDLPAELDEEHRARFIGWLAELGSQTFITSIQADLGRELRSWDADAGTFHVEHGELQRH
jgi:DNA replication and repair protein RecF